LSADQREKHKDGADNGLHHTHHLNRRFAGSTRRIGDPHDLSLTPLRS
jgi:hypothetical protein